MSKTVSSGDSLTAEDIQRFIEAGNNPPRRELVAPNLDIAKAWAKQYPEYTILLSAKHLPKPKKASNNE